MNTIVAKNIPTKSNKNVWAVYIEGQEEMAYCKSPYKAMRLMFLLKARTGAQISAECLKQLSQAIAEGKAAAASQPAQEVSTEQKQDEAPAKPKAKRKPRQKKVKVAEEAA